MTRRTIRASAAALGSAALLAVAGCGGGSSTTTQSSASAQGAQPQARAGGPFIQANLSALAKDLGVSTSRLLAANLAKQLNLSTTKVQQALAKVLPRGAQGAAPQASSTSSSPS
jgi:hypothetical protein